MKIMLNKLCIDKLFQCILKDLKESNTVKYIRTFTYNIQDLTLEVPMLIILYFWLLKKLFKTKVLILILGNKFKKI